MIVVQNHNIVTRNLKWNCFEFQRKHCFRIDFSISISHARFFFDDVWRQCRRNSSRKIHWCYCSLFIEIFNMRDEFDRKWSNRSIVVRFSKTISAESKSFLWNNMNFLKYFKCNFAVRIDNSRCQNVIDTMYFDWFSVNLNECEFLSSFWFWMTLYSCDFTIACFRENRHMIF